MGLKVGHSSRSLDEMVRQAKSDVTIRTALLEGRYVWGDEALYDEASRRFKAEVQADTARIFIAEKLAERDVRHTQDGRQPLRRRTQRQGGQGRPARPPHALLDRQIRLRRAIRRRAGRRRAVHARGVPPLPPRRQFPVGGALPPPPDRRPRRGPADLRLPARDRRADALHRPAGQVEGRAVHAALFPPGEGGRRPDRRVPGASRREVRRARTALRAADDPAAAVEAPRLRARSRAAGAARRRLVRRGSGAADRDLHAGRGERARNPPAGDARRIARRPAGRHGARTTPAPTPCSSTC